MTFFQARVVMYVWGEAVGNARGGACVTVAVIVAMIVAMAINMAFMAMTVRCGAMIRIKSRVKAGIERRVIVGIVCRV